MAPGAEPAPSAGEPASEQQQQQQQQLVTHRGGCHCGALRFEAQAPADVTAYDCNCSMCSKKHNTHFFVPRSRFRLDPSSEGHVAEYTFGSHRAKHLFCKHCGIHCHTIPKSQPDSVAVTLHCLDPGTIQSATIKEFNGGDL